MVGACLNSQDFPHVTLGVSIILGVRHLGHKFYLWAWYLHDPEMSTSLILCPGASLFYPSPTPDGIAGQLQRLIPPLKT